MTRQHEETKIDFVVVQSLSCVQLSVTTKSATHQAPLSMGFSRQSFWSGLPFPSPGDLLDPEIKPTSPALAGRFSTTELPRNTKISKVNMDCMCECSVARSCSTLKPYRLKTTRLLCPWDSPGKNTGECCHIILQGIFPTQGSNP